MYVLRIYFEFSLVILNHPLYISFYITLYIFPSCLYNMRNVSPVYTHTHKHIYISDSTVYNMSVYINIVCPKCVYLVRVLCDGVSLSYISKCIFLPIQHENWIWNCKFTFHSIQLYHLLSQTFRTLLLNFWINVWFQFTCVYISNTIYR